MARLTKDERTKKRFLVKESIIEVADKFSFDLSKSMGDILARHHDVSDLPSIRDVFDVLTGGEPELRKLLHDESMRLLFQRRNLILHRRAVVDSAYLARTGEQLKLSSELFVSPDDVEKYMELTTKAGIKLIHHAIELLKGA